MKKGLLIACMILSLMLVSCSNGPSVLSEQDIARIDTQETYADAPFSLVVHFHSLEEIYEYAEIVVDCTVTESQSVLLDSFPQTHSTVEVHEVLKGKAGKTLTVIEEGGTAADGSQVYLGVPPMEEGGHYILFLVDSGLSQYENSWCVAGAFQGKFIEREGYLFQQATEGVKLPREVYSPTEQTAFQALLPEE